ncbi:N-6 DNA methylase [Roseomonas hellenica]|uniref:site-specific DNA-methyltransferase (adenine-specific) n=1 Tax=Plastoroseomonas hellenica TaxID=2687306 RepID=A0ABS5F487_9PROT|nr:N-6 DNA methylase [Plastoroseomonas hellenica]MBR0667370.1 N-6 DNA methylase [Plastoroseomonas hellenica]
MEYLPTYDNTRSSAGLAAAFGWAEQDLKALDIQRGGTVINVRKGLISGEPAAIFGTITGRNGSDPLDSVALYAYHASAPWGVLADEVGLTVFNSQWLDDSNWFRLPRISWERAEDHRDLLDSLTPKGLFDRQPARLATKLREPTDFLKPVDDSLVERLDRWRDQALRYARHTDKVDELLQTFYAQLFVLRTVEDRQLDGRVEPVSGVVLGSDRFNRQEWEKILEQAQSMIGSDLFDSDVTTAIPEHVLAGVINELYVPHRVPGSNPRYNFSWIDADVLGVAYEKYLASVLQPTSLPAQVDLFLPAERGVERYSIRKSAGAYYTPKYITNYISETVIDDYFKNDPGLDPPAIIDFSCGSGSFLVAAIDKLLRRLKLRDPARSWARELIDGGHIAGIDIDPKAVTAARLHLWQRLIEEPDALPLPNLAQVVVTADGLDTSTWGALERKYNIVLGNPPFLATSLVGSRQELEARFVTARGRYDFSSLFVEQALKILADEGYLGLVVPNRLFRNRSGAPVRRLLTEQAHLRAIVDFGTTKPFDADAYVGCIIAKRIFEPQAAPAKVLVIEVRSLDADFLAALLLAAQRDRGQNSSTLRAFSAQHPAGDAPWMLLSDADRISRIKIEEVSVRLDSVASIPQGIRTGGNDFFYVSLISEDGGPLSRVENGFGEEFIIESALLEHSVYGSQVRRYDNIHTSYRLIYPYRGNIAISEPELEQRYPHAWSYFQRNRDILSSRASLKKSNGRYYELIWPRDEIWLRRPKLLIRDLAPTTAFAVDPSGRIFLVGGTAVVPEDPELLLALMAYLNSSVINNLVRQTTPQFRGSFQKFEPQHIQGIPILDRILEDEALVEQLTLYARAIIDTEENSDTRRTLETQVNELVLSIAEERGLTLGTA